MDGGPVSDDIPVLEWRQYRLCKLLCCTPSQLDEQPAVDLDWLLAIDASVQNVEANQAERANRAG